MKFFTTSKISENIRETPEGYLVCIGVSIARTGEMIYGPGETPLDPDPSGKVMVTREADEVFRPETIASFEGKSITVAHPKDFVTPENWRVLTNGVAQNVRRGSGEQENDLVADLLITSKEAIALVKAGLREVSCGYEAEYLQTGVGRGVQKNIIGNHIALVDEGRAGSSYAINDHKGKGPAMKVGDRIKQIFGKAVDEAMKESENEPAKDAGGAEEVEKNGSKATGYDELIKAVKDLGEKVSAMAKPAQKDATTPATENEPAKTVAKDDEVATGLEARLTKLEASVAKILASMTGDEDMAEDDAMEGELVGDDDQDGDEMGDAKNDLTGDTASRVEILAPGLDAKGKGIKVKALKVAYATQDGKSVIEQFTAGKAPDFKNEKFVDMLFTAASEVLKSQRSKQFAASRTRDFQSQLGIREGAMTPEQINEKNQKFYAAKA